MKISNAPGRKNIRRIGASLRLKQDIMQQAMEGSITEVITDENKQRMEYLMSELNIVESKIVPKDVALLTKRKIFRGVR